MGQWLTLAAQAVRRYLMWSREVWRSLPNGAQIAAILIGILVATVVTSALQPAPVRYAVAFVVLMILAALLTLVYGLVRGTPWPKKEPRRRRTN